MGRKIRNFTIVSCNAAVFCAAALSGCSSGQSSGDGMTGDGPDTAAENDAAADLLPENPPDTPRPDMPADGTGEPEECVQDMDILFVIDVSTSMTFVLDTLSAGIVEVWNYALTFSDDPSYDPHFGLVVFVDDVLFTNNAQPYATAELIRSEFDTWRAFTSSNGEPGGSPGMNNDCPENSIDALFAGATQFGWRDGALHIIIFATDDTFVERPGTLGSGPVYVQHTCNEVLSEVLAREIRVSAFAAHVGVCWDSNNGEPGFFAPCNDGSPPLPDATGSNAYDIQQVASGTINLTEAIKGILLDEYCTPFLI
jgi:hypothetical protein